MSVVVDNGLALQTGKSGEVELLPVTAKKFRLTPVWNWDANVTETCSLRFEFPASCLVQLRE
jgi:hypothetical protein